MNIIEKHTLKYSKELSNNDIGIIQNIGLYYNEIPNMKIKELADACFTSSTTVHRLIKKIGFEGFSEFKYKIIQDLEDTSTLEFTEEEYLENYLNNIQLTKQLNETEIDTVANIILNKNIKYCFGTGWKQKQMIDNFSTDLLYYGESFTTLRTEDDLRIASEHMDEESLLLIVSLSGNAKNYSDILKKCTLRNVTIISITADVSSLLSSLAHHSLYYKDDILENTAKHWNTNTLHFILDYLISTIVNRKNT